MGELFEYLRVALRQKVVIIATFLAITAITVLYVTMVTPVYEANGKLLLVEEKGTQNVGGITPADMMLSSFGKSDPIATQVEVLKTRPLYEEVIRKLGLKDRKNKPFSSTGLRAGYKFAALRNTNLIGMTCRHVSPDTAALLVNTLAEVFIENNQRLNQEEMRIARIFIENQLAEQKVKLQDIEQELAAFKKGAVTISLDQETSLRVGALAGLEAEKARLNAELQGVLAQKSEIDRRLNETGAQSSSFYSSWISGREQVAISETNLRARIGAVTAQIDRQNKGLKDLPAVEVELARLVREQKIAGEIYTILLSQYEEYGVREAAKVATVKLIEPAVVPGHPVFPRPVKSIAVSMLLGLMFGFGIAFAIEYIEDRPRTVDEIKIQLNTGMLGVIPYFDDVDPLFLRDNPLSLPSEAIRLIHTNLKFKGLMEKDHVSIMTTSSQPQEGKSTITANLGMAFAASGKSVALINLDLRRPAFDEFFGLKNKKGITDYLIGEASFEEIVSRPEKTERISVYGVGTIPPNPTELITKPRMQALIEKLKEIHDVVLIDTAPITMVAETLEIARHIDGIILVADISKTSRRNLKSMYELLDGKGLSVLGVIVNKYGKEMGGRYGYYHYRYGKYRYGYYTASKKNKNNTGAKKNA